MDAAFARRRDIRVTSLVGTAHGVSHFLQLSLPALFPFIHQAEGIAYTQLGLVSSVMYVASGVMQPPAGFLVDRFGARRVLLAGMVVMAVGTFLYGLVPSYEFMLLAAALIGAGNSVFHPCGYSVLSATVSEARMGRAFSFNIFGGYIGYGLAPIVMAWVGTAFGWQTAIMAAGVAGLAMVVVIGASSGEFRDSRHEAARDTGPSPSFRDTLTVLFQPAILLCWLFFMIVAIGQIGLQTKTMAILSLPGTWGMDVGTAGLIVSVMLFGVPAGVLLGGQIADRTTRHDFVVALCYSLAAVAMLAMWQYRVPVAGIVVAYFVTGFAYGVAFPSRDLLVRRATPKGSSGKVFGFVYAGMDFGSMIAPVLFGWFIDTGIPLAGFLCVAGLWFGGIFILMATTRLRPAAAQ